MEMITSQVHLSLKNNQSRVMVTFAKGFQHPGAHLVRIMY
jgi:hypothetical protein